MIFSLFSCQNHSAVWIARLDGSIQCESVIGIQLEEAREELKKAGVEVLEASEGADPSPRIQMCGMPTGKTVQFRISVKDLEKAKALGFIEREKFSPN